jgi:hypothetical protein
MYRKSKAKRITAVLAALLLALAALPSAALAASEAGE